jgi:hypothetical protein
MEEILVVHARFAGNDVGVNVTDPASGGWGRIEAG